MPIMPDEASSGVFLKYDLKRGSYTNVGMYVVQIGLVGKIPKEPSPWRRPRDSYANFLFLEMFFPI